MHLNQCALSYHITHHQKRVVNCSKAVFIFLCNFNSGSSYFEIICVCFFLYCWKYHSRWHTFSFKQHWNLYPDKDFCNFNTSNLIVLQSMCRYASALSFLILDKIINAMRDLCIPYHSLDLVGLYTCTHFMDNCTRCWGKKLCYTFYHYGTNFSVDL